MKNENYISTKARIINFNYSSNNSPKEISVEYEVNGIIYQLTEKINFIESNRSGLLSLFSIKNSSNIAKLPIGSSVEIYYNKKSPEDSYLPGNL